MISPTSPLITRSLARTVDDMLLDAGENDAALRSALLALGSLRSVPAPEPGAELAALLSGPDDRLEGPADQLARQRLLRRHRTTIVGLAVVAGMGLGVTGVAATGPAPAADAARSIQQLLKDWGPSWSIAGTPLAGQDNGELTEFPAPGEPARAEQEPGAAGLVETNASGAAEQENAQPGAGQSGTAQNGNSAGNGNGLDTATSKKDDGGAAGNSAGGNTAPGNTAPGNADRGGQDTGKAAPDSDGTAEVKKSGADADSLVGESLNPALKLPARTGQTGAGDADPGLAWLKKFSR